MRRADYSSRGVLQNVVSLSVIVNPRTGGGPGILRDVVPRTKIGASNERLTESYRNLKTERLCGLKSSPYIDVYKTEEDEMDR